MNNKVYFNYGSRISSKEISEAIGLIPGPGPICGFGSATINGSSLDIYPYGYGDEGSANTDSYDPLRYQIRDTIFSHRLSCREDADPTDYNVNFCFINKDGILYRSGDQVLHLEIEGVNSRETKEVLLFAEHNYVEEAVQNQPIIRAFWNSSSFNFYDLYKKSLDNYYPIARDLRKAAIAKDNDPAYNGKITYKGLIDKVESICETYRKNQKNMVFLGVYGEGFNSLDNNKKENFALIPYMGKFPSTINYNQRIHSYLTESIQRLENFVGYSEVDSQLNDSGKPFKSLAEYVEYLVNKKIKDIKTLIDGAILAPGSIILFEGENIPVGWEEYSKAKGRIVVGYTEGGIRIDTPSGNTQELTTVGSIYNPDDTYGTWSIKINGKNLPKHYHGIGLVAGRQDDAMDVFSLMPCNYIDRNQNINGEALDVGYNPVRGIQKGTVITSANLTEKSDYNSESTNDYLVVSKLPPAITLRYIRKKASV